MNESTKDWLWTIVKSALAAFLGAGLTALAQWSSGTDFGTYTPWVVALSGLAINAARKWVQESLAPPSADPK